MSEDRGDTVYLTPYETGTRAIKLGTFRFPHVERIAEVKKASMQGLADGMARSFDRGTGEALVDRIMLDPEFSEAVGEYGRLSYAVTLVEQSNP